jgi:hypothetical protein
MNKALHQAATLLAELLANSPETMAKMEALFDADNGCCLTPHGNNADAFVSAVLDGTVDAVANWKR